MSGDPQPKTYRKPRARKRLGPSARRADQRDAEWWAGQVATHAYRARCAARGVLAHKCGDRNGVDPQHVIPRSVRRDLAATVANIVPLCRTAHRWVDAHPTAAHQLGLHGYSHEVPMPRPPSIVATLPDSSGSVEQPAATPAEVVTAYERLAPWLPPDVTWSYRAAPIAHPREEVPSPPPPSTETLTA